MQFVEVIITLRETFPCNPTYPLHSMQIDTTKLHNTNVKQTMKKRDNICY